MVRPYRYGRDRRQGRYSHHRSRHKSYGVPRKRTEDYDYDDYEDYGPPPKRKSLSEDPRFIFGIIGAVALILIIVIATSSGGESYDENPFYNEGVDTELVEERAAVARDYSNRAGKLIEEAEKLDREMGSKVYATPKYQEALEFLREARRIWEEIETIYKQAGQRLPGIYQHAISGVERDIQYVSRQVGVGDY